MLRALCVIRGVLPTGSESSARRPRRPRRTGTLAQRTRDDMRTTTHPIVSVATVRPRPGWISTTLARPPVPHRTGATTPPAVGRRVDLGKVRRGTRSARRSHEFTEATVPRRIKVRARALFGASAPSVSDGWLPERLRPTRRCMREAAAPGPRSLRHHRSLCPRRRLDSAALCDLGGEPPASGPSRRSPRRRGPGRKTRRTSTSTHWAGWIALQDPLRAVSRGVERPGSLRREGDHRVWTVLEDRSSPGEYRGGVSRFDLRSTRSPVDRPARIGIRDSPGRGSVRAVRSRPVIDRGAADRSRTPAGPDPWGVNCSCVRGRFGPVD